MDNPRVINAADMPVEDIMRILAGSEAEDASASEASDGDTMKDRVRRFVALSRRKKALKRELDEVDEELKPLEDRLRREFEATGTQTERVDGMTVYVHHQLWARPKDGDQQRLCQALKMAGMEDIVNETVNIQTLSSVVRQLRQDAVDNNLDEDKILPPAVMECLSITVDEQLRARASK